MNVGIIAPQNVHAVWPKVEAYLAAAIEEGWSELYSLWDVKRACIDGHWTLWVAGNGEDISAALVTRFQDYPKARVIEALLLGGRGLDDWFPEGLAAIERHGRERGATLFQAYGRPGWARLCGGRQLKHFIKEIR